MMEVHPSLRLGTQGLPSLWSPDSADRLLKNAFQNLSADDGLLT